MSDTRYYLVKDSAIIEAIKNNNEQRTVSQKKASEFAKEHSLGDPVFRRWGIFDIFLAGFQSKGTDLTLVDKKLLVKPKDGIVWPRRKKGSKLCAAYDDLYKETKIDEESMEKVLGWKRLDFFPTSPGCNFKPSKDLYIFMMPARVTELHGCQEISNIEYLELTKETSND